MDDDPGTPRILVYLVPTGADHWVRLILRAARQVSVSDTTSLLLYVMDDDDVETLAAQIDVEQVDTDMKYFIVISWEYIHLTESEAEDAINAHDCDLHIMYNDGTKWIYATDSEGEIEGEYQLDDTPLVIQLYPSATAPTASDIPISHFQIVTDATIKKIHQVMALSRHYPVFPIDPIGIDYETIQDPHL
jgi:hypothetical protein